MVGLFLRNWNVLFFQPIFIEHPVYTSVWEVLWGRREWTVLLYAKHDTILYTLSYLLVPLFLLLLLLFLFKAIFYWALILYQNFTRHLHFLYNDDEDDNDDDDNDCIGLNSASPPKFSPPLESQNFTSDLIWKWVFLDVMKLRWGHRELRWDNTQSLVPL